jgi:hypothetical protein
MSKNLAASHLRMRGFLGVETTYPCIRLKARGQIAGPVFLVVLGLIIWSLPVIAADVPPNITDVDGGSKERRGPSQPPIEMSLMLEAISPFTTTPQVAPNTIKLPMHSAVTFRVSSNRSDMVFVWTGAEEVSRDNASSSARTIFQKPGTFNVMVTPVFRLPDGTLLPVTGKSKSVAVVVDRVPAEKIRISITDPTFAPIVGYAGKVFHCHAKTWPTGYEHLIEWTGGGIPAAGIGPEFSTAYSTIGRYSLRAGPSASLQFDIYAIASIRHEATNNYGQAVWYGFPITFAAMTDPPGFEDAISWHVDTMNDMHTSASPAEATGRRFTTTFSNPTGDGRFWAQVFADNETALSDPDVQCQTPVVSFEAPIAGDRFSTNEVGTIVASVAPPYDDPTRVANVEIFATSPALQVIPIRSGDLRFPMGAVGEFLALWDLTGLASGTYTVTARVTPVGCATPGEATVTVHVNQAPNISEIQVLSCSSFASSCGGNGFCVAFPTVACASNSDCVGQQVTFNVVASDPDGESIVDYVWAPGLSGQAVLVSGTSQYTTVYPPGASSAIVSVTAHDSGGGGGSAMSDLNLLTCTIRITNDCGCEEMEIFSVGPLPSFVYCSGGPGVRWQDIGCVAEPAPPAHEACPVGRQAFRCPIGPRIPPPRFGWGFEVHAALTDDTNNIDACAEGQFAQLTITKNGVLDVLRTAPPGRFEPPIPPGGVLNLPGGSGGAGGVNFSVVGGGVPYPAFNAVAGGNPQLGNDDYASPSMYKRHLPASRAIHWYDQPSMKAIAADAAQYRARFLTYVRGNNGHTCWCYFEMDHSWAANGPRTGPPGAIKLDGEHCFIP